LLITGCYLISFTIETYERGELALTWKGFAGSILFLILVVASNALWNANIYGSLVYALPGETFKGEFEVHEAEYRGSRRKSVHLDLKSLQDGKMYYLTLTKRRFNYPHFRKGEPVTLTGKRNSIGMLVDTLETRHYETPDGT
jgi:hypothetical protein